MKITNPALPPALVAPTQTRRPDTPEEAARQFEEILVKQFVKTMTDGLFETSLAGEGGPGWMEGYQDNQKDILTEELARHLVEQGTLRLSELLLRQWGNATSEATPPAQPDESKP